MGRRRVGRTAPGTQTFYVFCMLLLICGGPFLLDIPRPDVPAER